jgi:hypothetical protein
MKELELDSDESLSSLTDAEAEVTPTPTLYKAAPPPPPSNEGSLRALFNEPPRRKGVPDPDDFQPAALLQPPTLKLGVGKQKSVSRCAARFAAMAKCCD